MIQLNTGPASPIKSVCLMRLIWTSNYRYELLFPWCCAFEHPVKMSETRVFLKMPNLIDFGVFVGFHLSE